MKADEKGAYKVSTRALRLLAVLAECEAWLIPHPEHPTHPVALGFWVPARLADEARGLLPPATDPQTTNGRPPPLRLV